MNRRCFRSAGFQTCCIADFQIGGSCDVVRCAGLETGDTADLGSLRYGKGIDRHELKN